MYKYPIFSQLIQSAIITQTIDCKLLPFSLFVEFPWLLINFFIFDFCIPSLSDSSSLRTLLGSDAESDQTQIPSRMETQQLDSSPCTPSISQSRNSMNNSPFPPSVTRLWRPAAQRNLRNQWSQMVSYRQQWVSASTNARSNATSLVNAYLSQRY